MTPVTHHTSTWPRDRKTGESNDLLSRGKLAFQVDLFRDLVPFAERDRPNDFTKSKRTSPGLTLQVGSGRDIEGVTK